MKASHWRGIAVHRRRHRQEENGSADWRNIAWRQGGTRAGKGATRLPGTPLVGPNRSLF